MRRLSSLLTGLLLATPSLGNVCHTDVAILTCGTGTVQQLPSGSYGTISLDGTQVTGPFHTTSGSFFGRHVQFTQGTIVAGSTNLVQADLSQRFRIISGSISINESRVHQTLTMHSPDVTLNSSQTQSLQIKINDPDKPAHVQLTNTQVQGDIQFNNHHGFVCMDSNSKVLGQIIGGKITQQGCSNHLMEALW